MEDNGSAAGAAPIDPAAAARRQWEANMACGLSIRPATGALRMQTPMGLNPLPNYWEIVSGDYPATGFSISGYIHDDDARILTAAKDLLEACIAVNKCGNGGAKLSRAASDKVRAAIAKAGA